MPELKPCPFCGSVSEVTLHYYKPDGEHLMETYIPYCLNEDCFMRNNMTGFDTEKEAVEACNRRATHDD